jgi:hypothetical protein
VLQRRRFIHAPQRALVEQGEGEGVVALAPTYALELSLDLGWTCEQRTDGDGVSQLLTA